MENSRLWEAETKRKEVLYPRKQVLWTLKETVFSAIVASQSQNDSKITPQYTLAINDVVRFYINCSMLWHSGHSLQLPTYPIHAICESPDRSLCCKLSQKPSNMCCLGLLMWVPLWCLVVVYYFRAQMLEISAIIIRPLFFHPTVYEFRSPISIPVVHYSVATLFLASVRWRTVATKFQTFLVLSAALPSK